MTRIFCAFQNDENAMMYLKNEACFCSKMLFMNRTFKAYNLLFAIIYATLEKFEILNQYQ